MSLLLLLRSYSGTPATMADNVAITEGSGKNVATDDDGTAHHQYVKLEFGADNTQTKVSSSNPLPVVVGATDTVTVKFAPGTGIDNITNSIAVHVLSTNGTMAVNVGKVDGTLAIYLHSTGGTIGVRVGQIDGTTSVYLAQTAGTIGVRVGQVDGSIAIHLVGTGGSVAVKLDPGYNVVNAAHTIIIPSTVSATTSGVSASGVQVVAPEAGHSTKVYAYSVQTTGAVSMAIKFTNGAGTSPTEFWRPLVTAGGVTGVQGANLAVTPPGYLFATGANVTLAIVNDSASLVHYSIGYFKESA